MEDENSDSDRPEGESKDVASMPLLSHMLKLQLISSVKHYANTFRTRDFWDSASSCLTMT